ncbi:MAG: hypothetical protein JWO69_1356 [Thermoleophilia bacterium]|nr:hypothetical protein [Thermoleophilia bacterium]
MTSTNPFSRQQPVPGRGGPGDLGSPATWERRPLAQITTIVGERSGHATVVMAKGSNGFFKKPAFEPVGTDFYRAVQLAADRAGQTAGMFGGSAAQGVLQSFDGQLYLAALASESGIGVSLDGEAGPFNTVVTEVSVAKLHPALQAVVGKRVMIDLRNDLPQPLPQGGTVPYAPTPGTPQLPTPNWPQQPDPGQGWPTPYPNHPPHEHPAPPHRQPPSWWDRLTGNQPAAS